MQRRLAFFIIFAALTIGSAAAQSPAMPDTILEPIEAPILLSPDAYNNTIYAYPEQNLNLGFSVPDWKRIWINAGVLTGCYVAALTVLEMLI